MQQQKRTVVIKAAPKISKTNEATSQTNFEPLKNRIHALAGATPQKIIELAKSKSLAPNVFLKPKEEAEENLGEFDEGDDEAWEDEESEGEPPEPRSNVQFYGYLEDDRIELLRKALKPRNLEEEAIIEPSPAREARIFDLHLPPRTKVRLQQIFRSSLVKKFDTTPPPIPVETIPNYNVKLPEIGRVRKVFHEPFNTMREKLMKISTARPEFQLERDHEARVKNPFYYPKDIPAFMVQEENERTKKRLAALNIPTTEKLHGVSLIQQIVTDRVKPYLTQTVVQEGPAIYNRIVWEAEHGLNITRLQKVARKIHANYINYRKMIFYQEYAIHARTQALKQMHDIESKEEMALKNYEFLSNFTGESLDNFLRDNEESTNMAGKIAEDKMKANVELNSHIRNLKMETSSMKSEIQSLNESLRECKYYMKFLDGVARELMRADEEEQYRTEKRQQQIEEDIADYLTQGLTLLQAQEAIENQNKEYGSYLKKNDANLETESGEFIKTLAEEAKAQAERTSIGSRISSILHIIAKNANDASKFNEEELFKELDVVGGSEQEDREELTGLVFTKPTQLLNIYIDCEEQCLSLIQHAQINEESLESVEKRIQETRKSTEDRARQLRDSINEMNEQIQETNSRIGTLKVLIDMFTGGYYDVKSQEKMMKLLRHYVNRVYRTAIGVNDAHLDSMLMLTSIEKNFEDLVRDLESMPDEVVLKISRDLEKERREAERLEAERERKRHERTIRNIERSTAAKPKKGRSLAFRSRPLKLVVKLTQQELDKKAEQEEWNYYFGE